MTWRNHEENTSENHTNNFKDCMWGKMTRTGLKWGKNRFCQGRKWWEVSVLSVVLFFSQLIFVSKRNHFHLKDGNVIVSPLFQDACKFFSRANILKLLFNRNTSRGEIKMNSSFDPRQPKKAQFFFFLKIFWTIYSEE